EMRVQQELAADAMAVSLIGNAKQYMRGLGQLALAFDPQPRAHLSLLPTIGWGQGQTSMIRRIKSMKRFQPSTQDGRRTLVATIAITTVLLAVVAVMGLRPANAWDAPAGGATTNNRGNTNNGDAAASLYKTTQVAQDTEFTVNVAGYAERKDLRPAIQALQAAVNSASGQYPLLRLDVAKLQTRSTVTVQYKQVKDQYWDNENGVVNDAGMALLGQPATVDPLSDRNQINIAAGANLNLFGIDPTVVQDAESLLDACQDMGIFVGGSVVSQTRVGNATHCILADAAGVRTKCVIENGHLHMQPEHETEQPEDEPAKIAMDAPPIQVEVGPESVNWIRDAATAVSKKEFAVSLIATPLLESSKSLKNISGTIHVQAESDRYAIIRVVAEFGNEEEPLQFSNQLRATTNPLLKNLAFIADQQIQHQIRGTQLVLEAQIEKSVVLGMLPGGTSPAGEPSRAARSKANLAR
ncbi:MAG: hypothetical protein AAFP90_07235, partial [Planctomycetota bacterium]